MNGARVLQTALLSAGPEAARIERLWWLMFVVTAVVYVAVLARAWWAYRRGRRHADQEPREASVRPGIEATSDRTMHGVVTAAVAGSVVILLALLIASVWTNR